MKIIKEGKKTRAAQAEAGVVIISTRRMRASRRESILDGGTAAGSPVREAESIIWSSEIQVYGGCLWSRKTKKAVISCEKPREGAHIRRSADSRMG